MIRGIGGVCERCGVGAGALGSCLFPGSSSTSFIVTPQFLQTRFPGLALQLPQPSSIAFGCNNGDSGANILTRGDSGGELVSISQSASSKGSSVVQAVVSLLGWSGLVGAGLLSPRSACRMSCWLLRIVLSTLSMFRSIASSLCMAESLSRSSSSVSSSSGPSSSFGFGISHGIGWGVRIFLASHSWANCLNSMPAALMRSASVLLDDPFSLKIRSASACVGSPAYACVLSIQPHVSSTMFAQFLLVYVVLPFPPDSSHMSLL